MAKNKLNETQQIRKLANLINEADQPSLNEGPIWNGVKGAVKGAWNGFKAGKAATPTTPAAGAFGNMASSLGAPAPAAMPAPGAKPTMATLPGAVHTARAAPAATPAATVAATPEPDGASMTDVQVAAILNGYFSNQDNNFTPALRQAVKSAWMRMGGTKAESKVATKRKL